MAVDAPAVAMSLDPRFLSRAIAPSRRALTETGTDPSVRDGIVIG